MVLKLFLSLVILPLVTSEIVYARTNRLDQTEYDQWDKTCGMQSSGKKVPFKVMVYVEKSKETQKCVGVIVNKRFVLTSATCYYDRKLNDYNDDSELRKATEPAKTTVVVCGDDGMNCDKGQKDVNVIRILYPQLIHYSEEYETVADIALLEITDEFADDRTICTPHQEEKFRGQKIFLISNEITDQPYYEGGFEWKGEMAYGDPTVSAERYTFTPTTPMTIKPSRGLFFAQKDDRMYLLGTLKYEKDSDIPRIMLIFPYFHDFVCTNTGSCGYSGYDKYMFTRQTRVMLNGLPLPQVSHCDINFYECKYDPLFFRYLPAKEMDDLNGRCGKTRTLPEGQPLTQWDKFPFMAAIVGKFGRICSGAFISQVHVVTVAHCLFILDDDKDEFLALRDKEAGSYMKPTDFEVRYGSECYSDGLDLDKLNIEKCGNEEAGKKVKTAKVRSIIIEGLRTGADDWRYKYQLVLLELEQPTSKDLVVPICTYPGLMGKPKVVDKLNGSFWVSAAGAKGDGNGNSFIFDFGQKIEPTDCSKFGKKEGETVRIGDYNCRDDNVDLETDGKHSFYRNSAGFLGSQLSFYDKRVDRRYLYGLAHYGSPHGAQQRLGGFYPIWRNERFICWFTGVCYHGRPDNRENRHFKIYTPEYRLVRSVIDYPVQRAGKNNLSSYDIVMLEEMDTKW